MYVHFINHFLQGLIIASGFSLHNNIEEQMKVIVYTVYQPYLASVGNCMWIFIVQL